MAAAICVPAFTAPALADWVLVAGAVPRTQVAKAKRMARDVSSRCGVQAIAFPSNLIDGFKPDLIVVVAGAFESRSRALAARTALRRCVPDAYIKQGSLMGEGAVEL